MAGNTNQKLKLLYLMKILLTETDEEHPLTMGQIISKLALYDITAERKSIYSDIELLSTYGLDILSKKGKTFGYYIGQRDFELAELKLLVDSVQSSRFITKKKSNELIKKLEGLTSIHYAKQLQRQVFVADRVKTFNEKIYYNVDTIHAAMTSNLKIAFKYFDYTVDGKTRLRKNGEDYVLSPYSLTCSDDNYYLVTYNEKYEDFTHFRVDRMRDVKVTNEKCDQIKSGEANFNIATYCKKTFGMFNGETQMIKLEFHNDLINVAIDRFGEVVTMFKADEDHFTVMVEVMVSPAFYGWLFQFGEKVKVISPECVIDEMKVKLKGVGGLYE